MLKFILVYIMIFPHSLLFAEEHIMDQLRNLLIEMDKNNPFKEKKIIKVDSPMERFDKMYNVNRKTFNDYLLFKDKKYNDGYTQITETTTFQNLIKNEKCDLILNKFYYLNCYSYEKKSPLVIYYKVHKNSYLKKKTKEEEKFNIINIKDSEVKKELQMEDFTYMKSKKDKIHFIDIARNFYFLDQNNKATAATRLNTNKIFINNEDFYNNPIKKIYTKLNKYPYDLMTINNVDNVEVYTKIYFDKKSKTYTDYKISIPKGIGRMFVYGDKKECYYIPNTFEVTEKNVFSDFKISCHELSLLTQK